MRTRLARGLALLGVVAACSNIGPNGPQRVAGSLEPGGHHVLFVGNSLTYVNDLPAALSAIAASVGDTIRTRTVAYPDYALIDHLALGDAPFAIRQDQWEYVVLQQGPSTLAVNRDSLALWTQMFDPLIRAQGAKPALFMVWPDASRIAFFEACRLSYLNAAQSVNGVFFPAGEAWTIAWQGDPALALYGSDGFHPSPLGTYLAALVMYERITGHDARDLPDAIPASGAWIGLPSGVPIATAQLLQAAAHTANLRYTTG